ncbi:MAG: rhomboid family intramembrane serine protease [Candidatus Hodarchaeota archaeon]
MSFLKEDIRFPIVASILVLINGFMLIISFEWPRGHIGADWFNKWAIIPGKPELPQILTYCLFHFHLPHFLGVSCLLLIAGAYGEWRYGKKMILFFYIAGATVFALISIFLLKVFLYLVPSILLIQWFSQGLNNRIVGSSAASFSVYGSIFPLVKASHRPFYFLGLLAAIIGPIILFQTVNVGDWVHLVVPFLALGFSWMIYRRKPDFMMY